METVSLSPRYDRRARQIAEGRSTSFPDDFDPSVSRFGKDPENVDLRGVKSELAVAKHYGMKVDAKERMWGDETDFVIEYQGELGCLDVKSTLWSGDDIKLMVREGKMDSDWFLLTRMSETQSLEIELLGWVSRERLMEDGYYAESPVQRAEHYNYVMYIDELDPIPERGSVVQNNDRMFEALDAKPQAPEGTSLRRPE